MKIKLYADGADIDAIRTLAADPSIKGFTTNPTLMRQAGVTDYAAFARSALDVVGDRPISFEVLSDEFDEMERQARVIAKWGPNVYVKIPVTNARAERSASLLRILRDEGVRVNVTAIFTLEQVEWVTEAIAGGAPSNVSIFAGRIADAGVDPIPTIEKALGVISGHPEIELIWASPREVFNIVQADLAGCHIITVTNDLLKKLPGIGRDLDEFSLDTVKMFLGDATAAGFVV
jgi:transaldolase